MSENSHRDSRETTSAHRPRAFYTSLYGGLVVGILDLVFAFTFYGLIMGAKPMRIFQGVAAGVLSRPKAIEGGVPTLLLGIPASFCGCDMHSHRLLPCNSGAADLDSSSDYQRIELRTDRLFWDEVYRLATLSYRAKRDTATSTDLFDRSYWTRFPGGIAARVIGTAIR